MLHFFPIIGFHQGILRLAMVPTVWGAPLMEEGPSTKIELVCSPEMMRYFYSDYNFNCDQVNKVWHLYIRETGSVLCSARGAI